MGPFKKYVCSKEGGGGTIKAFENIHGEGVEAQHMHAIKNCK